VTCPPEIGPGKMLDFGLKERGAGHCGENGEYHTLVTDGPIFSRRIQLIDTRTIIREKYWFLDTVKYELSR